MSGSKFIFLFLCVAMLLSIGMQTRGSPDYAEYLDQRQDTFYGNVLVTKDPSRIGQSFIPSFNYITAIELYPMNNYGGFVYEQTVTVNLRKSTLNGTIVATASLHFTKGGLNWTRFQLASPAKVEPGASYVIEATTDSIFGINWGYSNTNNYTKGVAFYGGKSISDRDMCFRTYGYSRANDDTTDQVNLSQFVVPVLVVGAVAVVLIYWKIIKKR